MTDAFTSLTVIVGATDEVRSLTETVNVLVSSCTPEDIRKILIIYPGNASAGCLRTIGELERKYPGKVTGMRQSRANIGGAIHDGFDRADTSHLLVLPGDMAIGLDPIPEMIALEKQYPDDITKTSRWLRRGSFHHYAKTRKAANALGQVFLRFLFRTHVTDLTNPVQIMPTELCRRIRWREDNYPFLLEMVLCPLRLGVPIREVPTDCYGRTEGRSKNSAVQTGRYLKTALRIRFSRQNRLINTTDGR